MRSHETAYAAGHKERMRRMDRSVSFGYEKSHAIARSVRTPVTCRGLPKSRFAGYVRFPRPKPAQRCEIFLCFRECAGPWECPDTLPARTQTVSWIQVSIQMLRADTSARAISEPAVPLGVACLCRVPEFSRFCPIGVAASRARGLSTPVCPSLDSLSPNRTASCQSPVQRRQVTAPNGSRSARVGCR